MKTKYVEFFKNFNEVKKYVKEIIISILIMIIPSLLIGLSVFALAMGSVIAFIMFISLGFILLIPAGLLMQFLFMKKTFKLLIGEVNNKEVFFKLLWSLLINFIVSMVMVAVMVFFSYLTMIPFIGFFISMALNIITMIVTISATMVSYYAAMMTYENPEENMLVYSFKNMKDIISTHYKIVLGYLTVELGLTVTLAIIMVLAIVLAAVAAGVSGMAAIFIIIVLLLLIVVLVITVIVTYAASVNLMNISMSNALINKRDNTQIIEEEVNTYL